MPLFTCLIDIAIYGTLLLATPLTLAKINADLVHVQMVRKISTHLLKLSVSGHSAACVC